MFNLLSVRIEHTTTQSQRNCTTNSTNHVSW